MGSPRRGPKRVAASRTWSAATISPNSHTFVLKFGQRPRTEFRPIPVGISRRRAVGTLRIITMRLYNVWWLPFWNWTRAFTTLPLVPGQANTAPSLAGDSFSRVTFRA